tara:strand:- start:98 stop:550 length:453 start_codon:yes stop_codon:yes gene_type:complete
MAQIWHPVLVGANAQRIIELAQRYAAQVESCRVIMPGLGKMDNTPMEFFLHDPKVAMLVDYHTISLGTPVPFFPMIGDYVLYSPQSCQYHCLKNGWIDERVPAMGFNDLQSAKSYLAAHSKILGDAQVHYLPRNNSEPIKRYQARSEKAK